MEIGANLIASGIEYNAMMEGYLVSYTATLGGNEEAAAKLLEDMRVLSQETPLNMTGVTKATNQLLSYGVAAEDIIGTLRMLGDLAKGNNVAFNSIARAYGQMLGAGKLYSQDANQFINAGVPLWQLLSDYTGLPITTLRMATKNGEIGVDHVVEALKASTSEGGRFYNQLNAAAETYNGQLEVLNETWDYTVGLMSQPFFEIAKEDVLPALSGLLDKFQLFIADHEDTIREIATAIGNIAMGAFEGVITGVEWIIENKDAAATALKAFADGFTALLAVTHPVATALVLIMTEIGKLEALKNATAQEDAEKSGVYVRQYDIDKGGFVNWYVKGDYKENEFDKALSDMKAKLSEGDKSFLKYNVPETFETMEQFDKWIEKTDELLGTFDLPVQMPDEEATIEEIQSWWEQVKPQIEMQVIVSMPSMKDNFVVRNYEKTGYTDSSRKFATGLDYVPRDNFIASLHKGEAVLTAKEASEWRKGMLGGQQVYHDETIVSGNTFVIRNEQDIYSLSAQIASIKREKRRGRGAYA